METSNTIGKGMTVTIRDRIKNKSRSFTVYTDNIDELYKILKYAAENAK